MEVINKIIDKLFSEHKIKIRWMVFILLMVALGLMGSGGRYVAFGGEPNWSKTENEKSMRIESDIPLKGGEIMICPQVVLKYNGVIFMIINVRGVYCENKVQLINEKEKSFFQWMYSSDAKKRLENFRSTIYKMMKEEGEQLAIQQTQFCECELEWIAKVDYQNLKRNKGRKRQLLYSSGMVARIPWIFLCDEIALPEIWKSDVREVEII